MKLPNWLIDCIFDWAWSLTKDRADMTLKTARNGRIYMNRWHVIPRNRFLNIYLHEFGCEEAHSALHDHPYHSMSIILHGSYKEVFADGSSRIAEKGDMLFRRASEAHGIVQDYPDCVSRHNGVIDCWSLFMTGPRVRDWFFYQDGKVIPHEEFAP